MSNSTQSLEALAADIGENIYIDVAKWHLYLADAHLHRVVAEKAYALLQDRSLSSNAIATLLRSIPVNLGDGQMQVSLADLIPRAGQEALLHLLEEAQQDY